MKTRLIIILCFSIFFLQQSFSQTEKPVRIGIDGLSHDHIHGLLKDYGKRTDIQIVGIAEKNKELVKRLAERYKFSPDLVFDDLETMVTKTKPQGVVAFNSIYDHLHTVEVCAPRGIHVMVEKPLAVSVAHAGRIAGVAKKYNIMVLTNYETSWYPANRKVFEMAVSGNEIGAINKVLINDGHKGPVEIGCSKEFLAWLTDPVLNGGGAVIDFGCYGANLMTWLMRNETPESITAVLQTIKPEVYPKVDDQATIILKYKHAQAIIQGSWNWPVDRKDMEVYGVAGYVKALDANKLEYRLKREIPAVSLRLTELPELETEPFNYFANLINGKLKLQATDLASIENNLIVVKILEDAKESARTGKTVVFE
ncbi:MAG: Gfo/Idh/MocA family oxidoreductase [Candidatus Symbiothrix sp.]|jgi:predicted dehydrogenase|nr:Gfo/Idh/MocA family oxidoreductase [Candidatus Symbiothrix sp.]